MGSVSVRVEGVSDLLFQDPVLRGWWLVIPSLPYLRPSKDPVYSSQLSELGAPMRQNFPYKFRTGLGSNLGAQHGSTVRALTTAPPAHCGTSLYQAHLWQRLHSVGFRHTDMFRTLICSTSILNTSRLSSKERHEEMYVHMNPLYCLL